MIRAARAVDGWWYAPAPAERLAMLRILVGGFALGYVALRTPHFLSLAALPARRFQPVGPVSWLDGPMPATLLELNVALVLMAGAAFVLGWRYRVSAPLFALLLLWLTAYRNSWGQVFHTENLMVLHVVVLALAPAGDAWSLDGRGRQRRGLAGRYGWPIRLMASLTVLTYVIAGATKLQIAGLDWVTDDVLRNYVAYDNLRKAELGDVHSPLGAALVPHAWLFTVLAGLTLMGELGAPLALVAWRRLGQAWVVLLWGFHVGVLALMAIVFPYQLLGVAFAPFFAVERIGAGASRLARTVRFRQHRGQAEAR